jgi:hypothetical protein
MSRPQRKPALPVELSSVLVGDIMVGSFYDPDLDEGCAFEGSSPSTVVSAGSRRVPSSSIRSIPGFRRVLFGAASVYGLLTGWRRKLQGGSNADAQMVSGPSEYEAVEQPVATAMARQ